MFRSLIFLLMVCASKISFAQVQVYSVNTGNRLYTNLIQAFSSINSGIHTGAISVTITSSHSLSTGTATLVASGLGAASYTSISVNPGTGNMTISGSTNGPLILLNGADNVTIDGINSGTNSLTFTNSNTSQGHIIQLTNGASNNTITRCTLLSSNTVDFWGVITLMGNTGNSNNTITYNNIGSSSSGNPTYAIIARGETPSSGAPATQYSTNVTVRYNNIYNYGSSTTHSFGIYILDGHSGWTIQGNKFYQTATLTLGTTGTRYHGAIWIYSITHGGFSISDNVIGHTNSLGTGTYTINTSADIYFWPITLWLSSTATSNVDGNTVRAIHFTTNATGASLAANGSFGVFSAIWARSGNIQIGNTNGNTIGGFNADVQVTITNNTSATPATLVNGIFSSSSGVIKNNTISDMNVRHSTVNSTFPLSFYAISGTNSDISNNTIGHSSRTMYLGTLSGTNVANYTFIGINNIPPMSGVTIHNNQIQNIENRGHGSTAAIGGINISNAFNTSVTGNTISQLKGYGYSTSATSFVFVYGIFMSSINGNHVVNSNIVFNLSNSQSASGSYVNVYGMNLRAGSSTSLPVSNCNLNKIYSLSCTSSNPTYAAATYVYFNAGFWNVVNNTLAHTTNDTKEVYGIEFEGGTKNTYYNSVFIGGGNSSNGTSSCIKRTSGTDVLMNNLLFNSRTLGVNHSLMSSSSSILNINFNYNLYITSDTSTLIKWSSINRSWYAYYTTINSNDKFSWCAPASGLTNMFMDASTGDLRINPNNPNCWYINGKGMPVADIDYDWELANGDRSATISDGATDIGADEVVPTVAPPAATHTGSFAAGQSSVYVFGGRTIAQIDWQPGSTLPSSQPTVLYYSGNNPPYIIPGRNASNCYWKIDAPATAGMFYQLKLWMSPAVMGAIPTASDLRMAKNSLLNSSGWSCACTSSSLNTTTYSFSNTQLYNSFSFFTATDISSPLPVELIEFNATIHQKEVKLNWTTVSEINSSYFSIERSTNGNSFIPLGEVPAAGISYNSRFYTFTDHLPVVSTVYYRLRMVDLDGQLTYSPVRCVSDETIQQKFIVYPIPAVNEIHIAYPNTHTQETPIEALLFDLNGTLILQKTITEQPYCVHLPDDISDGMYILRLIRSNQNATIKLPVCRRH